MSYSEIFAFSAISVCTAVATIYTLPKSIFVKGINHFYPEIITSFKSEDTIALTIDDVSYGSEEEIIKICDKYNVKVTLFVIANKNTKKRKNFFVNVVKNGHQLANHGVTNSAHFLKSRNDLKREIEECWNFIEEVYREAKIPIPKKLYRPGCGLFSREMLKLAEELGFQIVLGSLYPHDPQVPFPMVNYHYLIRRVEAGDIVIVHDRKWTAKMLEKFFEDCLYDFKILDEI